MFKYNDSFKNEFLGNSPMNTEFTNRIFVKSEEYELLFKKDVSNFNIIEIKEFFSSLNSSSINYLIVVKSVLSNYTQFIIENSLSIDNINHYSELNRQIISECLNQSLAQKYIQRSEILLMVNELDDDLEKYYLLATYEGIYGTDFMYAEKDKVDYIERKILLPSGKTLLISDELLHIISNLNSSKEDVLSKTNDQYILKVNIRKGGVKCIDELTPQEFKSRIFNKMRKIKNYLEEPRLTFPTLYLSGLAYKIKEGAHKYNLSVDDYLISPEFSPVADFYDLNKYQVKSFYSSRGNMKAAIKKMLDGYL